MKPRNGQVPLIDVRCRLGHMMSKYEQHEDCLNTKSLNQKNLWWIHGSDPCDFLWLITLLENIMYVMVKC